MDKNKVESCNAVVESVRFGFNDYGYLEIGLNLKTERGDVTALNGINIGYSDAEWNLKNEHGYGNLTAYYFAKVCEVLKVNNIKSMSGCPVRALFMDNLCIGIQNYLDTSIFFIPRLTFADKLELDLTNILEDYFIKYIKENFEICKVVQNMDIAMKRVQKEKERKKEDEKNGTDTNTSVEDKNVFLIARDYDKTLCLFTTKPYREELTWDCVGGDDSDFVSINNDLFPNITFEDESLSVKLVESLKKNNE